MERVVIKSKNDNGVYSANIDITKNEWIAMLQNKEAFNDKGDLNMIRLWYTQPDYQSSSAAIVNTYKECKFKSFNRTVVDLGKRIIKHLNRFETIGTDGKPTYWIIPFTGWHQGKYFIWRLREELVEAIDELNLFSDSMLPREHELETVVDVSVHGKEGKKLRYFTTKYERKSSNRRQAIKIHGISCCVCGFNFEEAYGALGKDFIEVHHVVPLNHREEEVEINPATDLICVCSNCHRILHRRKEIMMTPQELQEAIAVQSRKSKA